MREIKQWLELLQKNAVQVTMLLCCLMLVSCNKSQTALVDAHPQQTLRSQVLNVPIDFAVQDMLFDGSYLWLLGYKPQIIALNPDTLTIEREFSGIHLIANGFAKVADTLWLINDDVDVPKNGFIRQIDANDGHVLDVIEVGKRPRDILFDGDFVWVANFNDNNVTRIHAVDNAKVETFVAGRGPQALAFDGENIWVANYLDDTVTVLHHRTGEVLGLYQVAPSPKALIYGNDNIWLLHTLSNQITALNIGNTASTSNIRINTSQCPVKEDQVCQLSSFDIGQQRLWITNHSGKFIVSLDLASGEVLEEISLEYPQPEKVLYVSSESHNYLFVSFYGLTEDSVPPPIARIELIEQ